MPRAYFNIVSGALALLVASACTTQPAPVLPSGVVPGVEVLLRDGAVT